MTLEQRPLDGVRVISLAEQYPGPYATLLLSDLGADVVLVERPDGGDPSRRFGEFFASVNRGKRSIELDLKDPAAVDACRELTASADVFMEGFRPGVAARLGLGAQTLCAEYSTLVYVSISGFGQDGPYVDRPAHDLSFMAMSGLLGPAAAERAPDVPFLSIADLTAGMFAAIAALSGLAARATSGRGGFYDVAMFDTLVSLLTSRLSPALNGAPQEGLGSDPGYGVFLTADGRWLTLSIAFEDHFWGRLCAALGLPALGDIPALERAARSEELRTVLGEILVQSPLERWERILREADVPHGAVRDFTDLAQDQQVVARELLVQAGDGERWFVRQPLIVNGERLGPRTGSPALGEHTAALLTELGWNCDRITPLPHSAR